jgi:small-conductance mechanosensitive channel
VIVLESIWSFLNTALFTLGSSTITLWTVLTVSILSFLLTFLTKKIQKWTVYRLLAKSPIDLGVRDAAASILRYLILTIGFIVILQTMGVDLSSLTILFGALGVGVGFGLQNITNNFVSGLVILFERPIKLGDRIELGAVRGDVIKISMRATTIRTNDNISVIVPNSEFVSSTVINWSHTDRNVRFNIPVGVSFREDPATVKRVLIAVAEANDGVLKEPPPDVLFDSYGESALNFNLRVWSRSFIDKPNVLRSKLYYEIFAAFKREGILIPYPQRDIHIKDMPEAAPPGKRS